MRLTDKAIRAAKAGDKLTADGMYGEGRLILIVSPKGRKSWVYRNRKNNKDTSKVLGTYPEIGLAEAVIAARHYAGKTSAVKPQVETIGTLEELLNAYVASLANKKTARETTNSFKLAFKEFADLLNRPANSITVDEVASVLRKKAAAGATTSVNRLRSGLHASFNYAAKFDYDPRNTEATAKFRIAFNPVSSTPRISEWERARTRVLNDNELKEFVTAAQFRNDALGDIWLLVLLTGARLKQLLNAKFTNETITITDSKGRGNRDKIVVLPVTERMKQLIFRASLAHSCHIDTVRKVGAALLADMKDCNPQDIRRTVETRLQSLGISREIRGALLSHGNTGVQARHYEMAEMLDAKMTALNCWHNALYEITVNDK